MIGQKLAHYEILALLGEGGMGEVYRAHDHKLGRDVAIKVLPRAMSGDPERIARFQREARTLAALQHPNVASVYGFEDTPEARFLVMELVEGEELTQRLGHGPLAVDEAVRIARQLADGLAAAHERNIVHRDLKPANIKFAPDGTVKILDFGLARAYAPEPEGEGDMEASPTITAAMTQAGTILGTAAYMSPEQAKGRTADQRADIWAWGVILWEMLAGERLFTGDSISDTLAGVLRQEVDIERLPADTPAPLRALLLKCLQRDPRERLQAIGDASIYFEMGEGAPGRSRGGAGPWRIAAAGLAVLSLALAGLWWAAAQRGGAGPAPVVHRWSFVPAAGGQADLGAAIAPDGHAIAYVDGGGLWLRERTALEARQLYAGEECTAVAWSPDSRNLLFSDGNRLLRMPATGGQVQAAGTVPTGFSGDTGALAWEGGERIVLGNGATPLQVVPVAGAEAVDLVELMPDELDVHAVAGIPGGRGWVYVVHERSGDYGRIDALSPGGERHTVLDIAPTNIGDLFVDPAGYLLFRREGTNAGIWAAPFDLDARRTTGEAFLVALDGFDPTVSDHGTLVYTMGDRGEEGELAWYDREGNELGTVATVTTTRPFPHILPGGKEILLPVTDQRGRDLWSFDAAGSGGRQLQQTAMNEETVTSNGDGSTIYTYSTSEGGYTIYRFPLRSPARIEAVTEGLLPHVREDLGRMWFSRPGEGGFLFEVFELDLGDPGAEARLLVGGNAIRWGVTVSPDGDYLAYSSNESGEYQVYLTDLPDAQSRWQVSRDGGHWPVFGAGGREILYSVDGRIYRTPVDTGDGVRIGRPELLLEYPEMGWSQNWANGFDVTEDGQRLLVIRGPEARDREPSRIIVVENWAAEFARGR